MRKELVGYEECVLSKQSLKELKWYHPGEIPGYQNCTNEMSAKGVLSSNIDRIRHERRYKT